MKKGPPRRPPGGGDCSISKRGCQAQKKRKFRCLLGGWHETSLANFVAKSGRG